MRIAPTPLLALLAMLLCLVLHPHHASSNPIDIRQVRVSGGNVNFIFNSLSQYTNGITYPVETRIDITYHVEGSNGWRLYVWADSDPIPSDGTATLPLSMLGLNVESFTANDGIENPLFALGDYASRMVIVSGPGGNTSQVDETLVISYSMGLVTGLMNRVEGFYYVNLHFQLEAVP